MCTFTVLNSIIYQTFRKPFATKIESIPFAYNFRKKNEFSLFYFGNYRFKW